MKRLLSILLLSLAFLQGFSQIKETLIQVPYTSGSSPTRTALLYLPIGYSTSPSTKRFPLLICMHGAGESLPGTPAGSTLYNNTQAGMVPYVIENGVWPDSFLNRKDNKFYQFIVVSPFSANGWSTTGDECEILKNFMMSNYKVDSNRLYTTGLSAGGAGSLEDAAHLDPAESNTNSIKRWKIAANVLMSEASNAIQLPWAQKAIADSIDCWGFGNFADTHGAITNDWISYMNFVRTGYGRFSQYTQGTSTGGHCCWNNFYDPSYKENFNWKGTTANMNIYEWMLLNARQFVSVTTADAGSNQTITAPTSSVTLTGVGTPAIGRTISSYLWSKVSGPAFGNITSPSLASTNVTGLVPGTFVYLLTVTDNTSQQATATVTITVNTGVPSTPFITVSADQTIALSVNLAPVTSSPAGTSPFTVTWTKFPFNQAPFKVVFIGSSTTVGTAATIEDSSFVGRLTAYWASLGLATTVNLGNGGSDLGAGLPTGTTPMPGLSVPDPVRNVTAAIAAGANVIFVNYPSNAYDASTVTPTVVAQESQIIYNYAISHGAQCFITTTQASRIDFAQSVQDKMKVMRDTLIARFGYHCVNFYDGLNIPGTTQPIAAYAAGDLIHFNNEGHRQLFEITKAKNIFQDLVPKAATIVTPIAQNTNIIGMDTGIHVFQAAVQDGTGRMFSATTKVTVNNFPPTSCQGATKIVIFPDPGDSSVFIDGSVDPHNPGDTILLNDGGKAFQNVVFTNLAGTASCPIVIMNDPSLGRAVKLRSPQAQIALGNCTHVRVTGSGVPGVQYGFDLNTPGGWTNATVGGSYFAYVTSGRSANIEWDHLFARNAAVGFEVKQDGLCDPTYNYPNFVMDSIIIHDNKVVNIWNEGMYIGNTSPDNGPNSFDPRPVDCDGAITYPIPIRIGYIHVYNNIVDSTGRGGIQFASGNGKLQEADHNTVTHNGWSGDDAQGTAISFGTYTWVYIHDNTVRNTYTWGIANLGGGVTDKPMRIENNTVDSSGYMQYYIDPVLKIVGANTLQWPVAIEITTKPVDSLPAMDSTQFVIKTNKIGLFKNIDGFAFALDDVYNRIQRKVGNVICGNTALNGVTPVTTVYNNNCAPCIPFATDCNAPAPTPGSFIILKKTRKYKYR